MILIMLFVLLYPFSWFLCRICVLIFFLGGVFVYFSILGVRLWFASFASFRIVNIVVFFVMNITAGRVRNDSG